MIQVKNVKIGAGLPKICVPIVETTQEQILNQAQEIDRGLVDLVEWRADFFYVFNNLERTALTASLLQSILGKIPILFTFRTAKEGGEREISFDAYRELLLHMAKSGCVDLIDVEVFRGYDKMQRKRREWKTADSCNREVQQMVKELSKSVVVVGSYHNFNETPSREEILKRIFFMEKIGAAIPKIAVMPKEQEDVICLMETTLLAGRLMADRPVITMAMGALGKVTRMAGESFGSAVTFGCMGKASAPGQIEVEQLRQAMQALHIEED